MLRFHIKTNSKTTYIAEVKGAFASDDAIPLVRAIAWHVFPDDAINYDIKVDDKFIELDTDYGKLIGEEVDE